MMKRQCPDCKKKEKMRLTHPEGFWEKKIFPLLLLRPHRCQVCWGRFYRFNLHNGVNGVKRARKRERKVRGEQLKRFFKAPDEKEFQELVRQIRDAETKMFGHAADLTDDTVRRRIAGN